MTKINSFNHFSEVLEVRMIEKMDVIFEKGSVCMVCSEKKYVVLVDGVVKDEICPACNGELKVIDLIKEKS